MATHTKNRSSQSRGQSKTPGKSHRGFAAMNKEKQREGAKESSQGGKGMSSRASGKWK